VLELLYFGVSLPPKPVTEKHISKEERNQQICTRHIMGENLQAIAEDDNISLQRVHQIVHRW